MLYDGENPDNSVDGNKQHDYADEAHPIISDDELGETTGVDTNDTNDKSGKTTGVGAKNAGVDAKITGVDGNDDYG